jgi:hypothetical protein
MVVDVHIPPLFWPPLWSVLRDYMRYGNNRPYEMSV